MRRRCFYSFHYKEDCQRAAQIRQIGSIEGSRPATDNTWEQVKRGGDAAIQRWINTEIDGRSCTVVLIGAQTANRKWINYEIVQSWNERKGLVGIYVHGIKNLRGELSYMGRNPFEFVKHGPSQRPLSSIVKCYNPAGVTSKERYGWIARYLSDAVEEAIRIRNANN
jgi:hypothetical protein